MRVLADHELKNEQREGLSQFQAVSKVRVWVVLILCYWVTCTVVSGRLQMKDIVP